MNDYDRFWSKVDNTNENGCWTWTAGKDKDGYGKFSVKHISYRAHRVSFAWFVTFNKDDLFGDFLVCHTCDNPSCVRPDHLFKGTQLDNNRDMRKKGRNRPLVGEECLWTKLTAKDKECILELVAFGKKQKDVAKLFKVSKSRICQIIRGYS